MNGKRVLVAPLDWGLGHATRCIPIIEELLKRNCEVSVATSGSALALLRKEFYSLTFFELPSYKASYSIRMPLMIAVFFQLPKFWRVINAEHNTLEKIIDDNNIDMVISDNRFGCWTKNIPCIFITHQINIQMPWIFKGIQPIFNYQNRRLVKRFTRCWIPDRAGELSLSGKLSTSGSLEVSYIGILSRLKKVELELRYRVAVILSGPEPQRTVLEELIIPQLKKLQIKSIVIQGIIEDEVKKSWDGDIEVINFLPTIPLEEVINQSAIIIARSGYSTVMDLSKLNKKALFIPTPGQTEQEYIAKRLMDNGVAFSMKQNEFDLAFGLSECERYKGFSNIEQGNELLQQAIDDVIKI